MSTHTGDVLRYCHPLKPLATSSRNESTDAAACALVADFISEIMNECRGEIREKRASTSRARNRMAETAPSKLLKAKESMSRALSTDIDLR